MINDETILVMSQPVSFYMILKFSKFWTVETMELQEKWRSFKSKVVKWEESNLKLPDHPIFHHTQTELIQALENVVFAKKQVEVWKISFKRF